MLLIEVLANKNWTLHQRKLNEYSHGGGFLAVVVKVELVVASSESAVDMVQSGMGISGAVVVARYLLVTVMIAS